MSRGRGIVGIFAEDYLIPVLKVSAIIIGFGAIVYFVGGTLTGEYVDYRVDCTGDGNYNHTVQVEDYWEIVENDGYDGGMKGYLIEDACGENYVDNYDKDIDWFRVGDKQ